MADDECPGEETGPGAWEGVGQHAGHGLTWALAVLVFMLAGWWIDGSLGTIPVFTILGAFFGAAAGFYSVWVHLIAKPREMERQSRMAEGEDGGGRGNPPGPA